MKALLLAAMPVVLMDGTAPDLNHWLRIELFIDPDGDLGASYTAVIENRSLAQVRKQLKLASQRGRIGQLSADQLGAEVQVSCTVAATGQG